VGPWLAAHYQFDALYSSPLERARRTAELINNSLGLPVVFKDGLKEADGVFVTELLRRPAPLARGEASWSVPPGTYYETFQQGIQSTLNEIIAAHPQGTILIVAHGGTIGTIIRTLLGVHDLLVHTDNTGVHDLRWRDGIWSIRFMNYLEHLLPDLT
jgi:broad specificity phosphatase PhoE